MDGRFARSMARLHRVGSRRLADSVGCYVEAGKPPVRNLPIHVDENLLQNGPEGAFRTGAFGVGWYKRDLPCVPARGGVFEVNGQRLIVEDIIDDDGHWMVAACMEMK